MPWPKGRKKGVENMPVGRRFQPGDPGMVAENNPAWRGDRVSYSGLHKWVAYHRPATGVCQVCGGEGYTENANLSGEYHRDLDDFQELCKPCHIAHDAERRAA